MNLSLICLSFLWLNGGLQTPNCYEGYPSAREASKKTQKEMIIFFSKKSCGNCEAAWVAFTKDTKATQQYISTRMDVDDFDGGVFFGLLALKQVPAWVIFSPDGTEEERWEGGWKDASGNPTLFDTSTFITNAQKQKMVDPNQKTTTKDQTLKINPPSNNLASTPLPHFPPHTLSTSQPITGYILQAGYFGSEMNAQKMKADLKNKGFTSFEIKSALQNGSTFFRVISKVFVSEMEAVKENERLAKVGIKGSVKKVSEL